jgi:hypothetical protein
MKILVTNHHLQSYTGTETSTLTLCKYLSRLNHHVTVYSKFFSDEIFNQFFNLNVHPIKSLGEVSGQEFDIGHIHHNICAYEVRNKFPHLPLVMWIHGVIPFLCTPPLLDLNISYFLTNNIEGKKHVSAYNNYPKNDDVFRNMVDKEIFFPASPINNKPKFALILSNKIGSKKEKLIKTALDKLNIGYDFVGARFKTVPNFLVSDYINRADIVFTVALGAMESMFCGRIPIIFDDNYSDYCDGIVTSQNFNHLKNYNFSGRATKRTFTLNTLTKEILKYRQNEGESIKCKALKLYDADTQTKKIIAIYQNAISSFRSKKFSPTQQQVISSITNLVDITLQYSKSNNYIHNQEIFSHYENTVTELEQIKNSRYFKFWPIYKKFFPNEK